MADASRKTTQKRQNKENNNQNTKRKMPEGVRDSQRAEESMEVIIVPDVAFENGGTEGTSMELENLSPNELLTQAKLSHRREKAIEQVFGQKYGTKWLEFGVSYGLDVEKWIKIVRIFGRTITKLHIDYWPIGVENSIEVDRCVSEYCADSLIELKIKSAERYNLNHLEKPFSKIETLEFKDCHLTSQSTDFNRWFPMMRRLVFSGHNSLVDRQCIETHFPYLKELEIEAEKLGEPVFEKSNVAKALRMNPYLMRLKISGDLFDVKFLCRISPYLQRLESLEIGWKLDIFACLDLLRQCKSLKSFHFQLERDSNFDDLKNSLEGEWQASNEGGLVKLNRVTDVSTEAQNGQTSKQEKELSESEELAESDEEYCDSELTTDTDDTIESEISSGAIQSNEFDELDFSDLIDDNLKDMEPSMELNELLQGAESNAQRKSDIDTVFLAKYRVKTMKFSLSYDTRIMYQNDIILIGNVAVCLDFLYCYGHLIKKISFEFHKKLFGHLNECCADSLIELNIYCNENNRMGEVRDFGKSFAKVEVLEFSNCFLNRQLTDFNKWFPQIRSIKFLDQTDVADDSCTAVPFSHLEHLTIDIPTTRHGNECDVFNVENVKLSLRLNPQLRSVAFYNIDAEFLRGISEHLQYLESLDIKWNKNIRYSELMGHTIQFRSVQKLDVKFHSDDINAQEIPLSFDRLQSFTLEAKELNDNLFAFIRKHPTITELFLTFKEESPAIEILQFAKALPSLKRFNMNFTLCSFGGIFGLLEVCQSLKKFRFRLGDRLKYDSLRQLLDDKWQASIDDMDFIQLKRIQ